jgi:hypothetical protein
VLHEQAFSVPLKVVRIHAQRRPLLADAALLCYQLEFFAEHAHSPFG